MRKGGRLALLLQFGKAALWFTGSVAQLVSNKASTRAKGFLLLRKTSDGTKTVRILKSSNKKVRLM